ncbi:hypothetical protein [Campylobacter jejuni]|uniref:hypothetical protein n=1 Tax=Campylobacter jejuni TaxID=197 RepID=UPI00204362B2|nr:hypothetical protein [Campylobacter jejuni]
MAEIAPDLIKNQIMGLWFVASALGNFVAGFMSILKTSINFPVFLDNACGCFLLLKNQFIKFLTKK